MSIVKIEKNNQVTLVVGNYEFGMEKVFFEKIKDLIQKRKQEQAMREWGAYFKKPFDECVQVINCVQLALMFNHIK